MAEETTQEINDSKNTPLVSEGTDALVDNAAAVDEKTAPEPATASQPPAETPTAQASEDTQKQTNQIPILGDLPIIGLAFRDTIVTQNSSELLIILSPHIYKGQSPDNAQTAKFNEITQRPLLTIPEVEERRQQEEKEKARIAEEAEKAEKAKQAKEAKKQKK